MRFQWQTSFAMAASIEALIEDKMSVDKEDWYKSANTGEWWGSMDKACPVCRIKRGDHFDAYCPTIDGKTPWSHDANGVMVVDYTKVRGRYGIPYPGANKNGAAATSKGASGCKCTRCLEWYEYAVPVEKFVCYGCRH